MKCLLSGVLWTMRYGLRHRSLISGHKLQYTGEVYLDFWVMRCMECSKQALTDLGPQAEVEEI